MKEGAKWQFYRTTHSPASWAKIIASLAFSD